MKTDLDQHWSAYYNKNADFRMITSRSLSAILEHVDQKLKKTCLDIGCGTGQLTRELNHRGYECVGVDASSTAIQLAQSLTDRKAELHYRHFDIEKDDVGELPLQPYSLVTCKLVYAFIEDRATFLSRVDKLLASRGTFVVITPVYRQAADATPISVEFETTYRELQEKFHRVDLIEDNETMTIVCHKG